MQDPTLPGIPTPARIPAPSAATIAYPEYREPGDRPREYLLEVAASARRDSWPLAGDRGLIEDICREFEVVQELLVDEQDRALVLIQGKATAETRVAELEILLRAERNRYEREALAHHKTTSQLFAKTAEVAKLVRRVEIAELFKETW